MDEYQDITMGQAVAKAILHIQRQEVPLFFMGLEREGLRVTNDGSVALTPHPAQFGEKLVNEHIKTDFFESQLELVTSPQPSAGLAYEELSALTRQVSDVLSAQAEQLWNQSMPAPLPAMDLLATSVHPGDSAKPLRDYLEQVRKKYRPQVQAICGIHCNVSFSDAFWRQLHLELKDERPLDVFCDAMYMKIVRNYLRHGWLVLLLTGCSPAVHSTFGASLPTMERLGDLFLQPDGVSIRSSSIGYQNPVAIDIDYRDVASYCRTLAAAVEAGLLIDSGELFASIKPKGKKWEDPVVSLPAYGVQYLELRNIDLNMFDPNAVACDDMQFLPLFLLYLLQLEEPENENWLSEARSNSIVVAQQGRSSELALRRDGAEVPLQTLIRQMLMDLYQFNHQAHVCHEAVLQSCLKRISDMSLSYSHMACETFRANGFIAAGLGMDLCRKLEFKQLELADIPRLMSYASLRPNRSADSTVFELTFWRNDLDIKFAICEDRAVFWLVGRGSSISAMMPWCRQADLSCCFLRLKNYFNNELQLPLYLHLADEQAVMSLHLKQDPSYDVADREELRDYLYAGDALRTLSGKVLQKKKNHINGFLREYEGRYEYVTLQVKDRPMIEAFLERWYEGRASDAFLDSEHEALIDLLHHEQTDTFAVMGGLVIDGSLQAFTMASYNAYEDMVIIHIEKANHEYRGIYQFINQQFLLHEFPTVRLVNREDDFGQEGLRKAKLSYAPSGFEHKYLVRQKVSP